MPGIIGCFKSTGSKEELIKGRTLLSNQIEQIEDNIHEDSKIICSRVHLGIIGEKSSPSTYKNIFCWLEGEFYNIDFLQETFQIKAKNESSIIIEAYVKGILKQVLEKVDGYFCCNIYDKEKKVLVLISDRFGLKPLYIWRKSNQVLGWSSEIKGFFPFVKFEKKINKNNLSNFLACGHYLENTTLFDNVNLIEPATILTINCERQQISSSENYWSWSAIKPLDIPFEEAVLKFGTLLTKAIHSRMENLDELSVSLSGGLDSRVILAAAKIKKSDIKTFTFGTNGSYEQSIAAKVAKAAKVKNQLFHSDNTNWFNKRVEGVWKTDGMLNIIHMHGSNYHKKFSEVNPICLHGIGGGILLGGRLVKEDAISAVQKLYGKHEKYIDLANPFFQLENKECQYLINNRLRRFTLQGILEQKYMEYRIPFFQNELINFIFSIPDTYRMDSKLFNKTLLSSFPELFDKIPYSNISYPISGKRKFISKLERKIHYYLYKFRFNSAYDLTDYSQWFNNIKPLIDNILSSKKSIYKQYLSPQDFKNTDFSNTLLTGRIFTIELYLQQIFNNRFLTTEDFLTNAE